MTAPMPETMSPREKVAALKTNDPTNPAHRLASDLQAGHFAVGDARDDLIEVLSNLPRYASLASSGDHAELARLAEAATPGTWAVCPSSSWVVGAEGAGALCVMQEPFLDRTADANVANAAFIAAANPATVLALIAENAALRGERNEWRDTVRFNERCWSEERGVMIDRATEAERKLAEAVGHVKRLSDWIEHEVGAELPYAEGEEDARTFLSSKEAERG